MIASLEDQLLRDEGEKLSAYQDSLGFWTIGVGHLIDQRKGGSIPQTVSRTLLAVDMEHARNSLAQTFLWTDALDEIRRGALLNMTFQMGVHGLGEFRQMLANLQVGNYAIAAGAGRDSVWCNSQSPARAERLMKQIETGEWQ